MRISSLDVKLIFFCAVESDSRENSSLAKCDIRIRSILPLEVTARFTRTLFVQRLFSNESEHAGAELLREGGQEGAIFQASKCRRQRGESVYTRGGLTTGGFDR